MARVDLTVEEITDIARSLEDRAERLAENDMDLALRLSLIHLKLLKTAHESLQLDRAAFRREYGI